MDIRMKATLFLLSKAGTELSDTPLHDLLAEFGAQMFEAGRDGAVKPRIVDPVEREKLAAVAARELARSLNPATPPDEKPSAQHPRPGKKVV